MRAEICQILEGIFWGDDNGNFFFFFLVFLFRATPSAYGSFQARSQIGTVATGPHNSHSNMGSESCLRPIPQHMATQDP